MSLFARIGSALLRAWNWVWADWMDWFDDDSALKPTAPLPAKPSNVVSAKQPEKVIGALFADCAGTLFGRMNELSAERVAEVQALSEQLGLPVIVWTGTKPCSLSWDDYEDQLKAAGLEWALVSKLRYEGRTVAAAFDNDSEICLKGSYGIKCEKFFRVASIDGFD